MDNNCLLEFFVSRPLIKEMVSVKILKLEKIRFLIFPFMGSKKFSLALKCKLMMKHGGIMKMKIIGVQIMNCI